jgi:hypothetical protein
MKNYNKLIEITEPYLIAHPDPFNGYVSPLYDSGVCGVIENFFYEEMDKGNLSASFSYLDFACDGETVQGVMTITIMEDQFIPELFTYLYEKDLRTYG